MLGLLLGSAARHAVSEDSRHGPRLLGPDGDPPVLRGRETRGAVLGPGPGLLGDLRGMRDVQEPRHGEETHHLCALPDY